MVEKRKDLGVRCCVSPKYYAGYYKRIDKEARMTKFIEVLIDEKPESKRDAADGRQLETLVETDTLKELGANRRATSAAEKLGMMRLNPAC